MEIGKRRSSKERRALAIDAVIDLASTPVIAQRNARANDLWEALFPTIMMGDDRAIRATWVNGKPVARA